MKKILRFLTLSIVALIGIAAFSMPVFAQDDAAAKKTEECNKIYNEKFLAKYKDKLDEADIGGREYLEKCSDVDAEITKFVKNWVTKYEWKKLLFDFDTAFNKKPEKDYPNVYKYGKEILAKTPEQMGELVQLKVATGNEYIPTTMKLALVGYYAEQAKNTAYRNEATNYAKQSIQLLDSGKVPDKWEVFKDKDEAYAWLNFALGYMWKEASPKEAAAYFYKTLNYNSSLKTAPATYIYISSYYIGEYKKVTDTIKAKCENVPDNDECKALDDQQAAWMDRWADALARAVSVAQPNDPNVKDWKKTLSDIFKVRYNLTDEPSQTQAVNEYLGKVQSKPLPDPATEPKPDPVREVKKDASTSDAKPTGAITSTTSTNDVAMGNGTTPKMNGANGATTNKATDAGKTAPAKKAPAKAKGKAKKPTR